MLADNNTGFAAIGFEQISRDGEQMAVLAVRATYLLGEDGTLTLADEQEIVLADEYEGDPDTTRLTKVGDLIPFKPAADITVVGKTYPPDDKPSAHWQAGIKVGSHPYVVRINGSRRWVRSEEAGVRTWKAGPAKLLDWAPLDYRYSAGGKVAGVPESAADPRNPIGRGRIDWQLTPDDAQVLLPIFDSADHPGDQFPGDPEPQGLAPIPPWWQWRQRHVGTCDHDWMQSRHPLPPKDFDYRFYQTAHPKLIMLGYLTGNEHVQLLGLTPGDGYLAFDLPGVAPYARFAWTDVREVTVALNCDGLHIDARETPIRVALTWRAWVDICPNFFKIDLFLATLGDPILAELPRRVTFKSRRSQREQSA